MAKMNSAFKYMYDAAPSIALLPKDGAVRTATFNGPEKALDQVEGYWNTNELADKTFAVVVHVTELNTSKLSHVLTLTAVEADDEVGISDGSIVLTFKADDNFAVGADDDETAANLADAINDAHTNDGLLVTAFATNNTVTLISHTSGTVTALAGGSIVASAPPAGPAETYTLDLVAGPAGFATSVAIGKLTVSEVGQYVILVDIDTLRLSKPDATAIRLVGTLNGAQPRLTAHAWITGIQR